MLSLFLETAEQGAFEGLLHVRRGLLEALKWWCEMEVDKTATVITCKWL